jgi:hypothetical protein
MGRLFLLFSIMAGVFSIVKSFVQPNNIRSMATRAIMSSSRLQAETASTTKPITADITSSTLQSLDLYDQYGFPKRLGDLMGPDKSVVVFLRHLG